MKRFHKALAASFKTRFPTLCKYWLTDISTVNALVPAKQGFANNLIEILIEKMFWTRLEIGPGFCFPWELFPENR